MAADFHEALEADGQIKAFPVYEHNGSRARQ
jgi:hypothetical protein